MCTMLCTTYVTELLHRALMYYAISTTFDNSNKLTNLQVLSVDSATHSKKLKYLSFTGTLLTFVFMRNVWLRYLSEKNVGLTLEFSYYISHSTSIPVMFLCKCF